MRLTEEEFRAALPDKMKKSINSQLIDKINGTLMDEEEYENYRNNLISYTRVMADGKFKIEQYLDAVRYTSFKIQGATNIEAYAKTFPDKIQRFQREGVSDKDIASYVSAYNKGKLVNLIMEQTLVPTWVLNQDLHQKAINHLATLMITAKSEKVQADSAAALLTHLKPPEAAKVELQITHNEDNGMNALKNTMMELVQRQKLAIESGMMNVQEVAHQRLGFTVDVEAKEVK